MVLADQVQSIVRSLGWRSAILAARPLAPGAMSADLGTGVLSRHIGRLSCRAAVLDQPKERHPRNRVLGFARNFAGPAGDCRGQFSEWRVTRALSDFQSGSAVLRDENQTAAVD